MSLSKTDAPSLSVTFACTILQFSVFLIGTINFSGILDFCRATNQSKDHPWIKNALVLLMYLYAPIAAVCITFSWISWNADWRAGWFFIWFPFADVILFFFVVLATKNDVSHFIDVHRAARAKLPHQPPPRPMTVAPAVVMSPMSPPAHAMINMDRNPPTLPQTDDRYEDDEDAF